MIVIKIKEEVAFLRLAGAKAVSNVMPQEYIYVFWLNFLVKFRFVRPLKLLLNQLK
jgi:hypothetical protein